MRLCLGFTATTTTTTTITTPQNDKYRVCVERQFTSEWMSVAVLMAALVTEIGDAHLSAVQAHAGLHKGLTALNKQPRPSHKAPRQGAEGAIIFSHP